jgi:hypothetical protein
MVVGGEGRGRDWKRRLSWWKDAGGDTRSLVQNLLPLAGLAVILGAEGLSAMVSRRCGH